MKMNPEALYMQLGRLVESMPQLHFTPTDATHRWIGKLDALLAADDDKANLAELRANTSMLLGANTPLQRGGPGQQIATILHRALAAAELNAPVPLSGSFIPAGNALDAMAAIAKVHKRQSRTF